jgi:hypothetical protein
MEADATTDPIFALIEKHREADAAHGLACRAMDEIQAKLMASKKGNWATDADYEAADDAAQEAAELSTKAAWDLIDNPPTTPAGVVALLRYATEHGYRVGWPDGEEGEPAWERDLHLALADALEQMARASVVQRTTDDGFDATTAYRRLERMVDALRAAPASDGYSLDEPAAVRALAYLRARANGSPGNEVDERALIDFVDSQGAGLLAWVLRGEAGGLIAHSATTSGHRVRSAA